MTLWGNRERYGQEQQRTEKVGGLWWRAASCSGRHSREYNRTESCAYKYPCHLLLALLTDIRNVAQNGMIVLAVVRFDGFSLAYIKKEILFFGDFDVVDLLNQ